MHVDKNSTTPISISPTRVLEPTRTPLEPARAPESEARPALETPLGPAPRTLLGSAAPAGVSRSFFGHGSRSVPNPYGARIVSEALQDTHLANCRRIAENIRSLFGETATGVAVAKALREVLKGIDLSPYRPNNPDAPDGYAKYLIHRHVPRAVVQDPDEGSPEARPWCIQLFVFAPKQRTSIHDHPCECGLTPVQGTIVEHRYDPDQRSPRLALELPTLPTRELNPGEVAIIDISRRNIHRLENRGETAAMTAHVYEIDGVERPAAVNRYYCVPMS